MNIIIKIIDFVWPFFEDQRPNYKHQIEYPHFKSENLKKISLDLTLTMHNEQRERIKTIESKSIVLIGFFGSVIAIFSFLMKDIISSPNNELIKYLTILFSSILILYSTQVLRHALNALQRKKYSSLEESDFIDKNENEIIQNIINNLKKNYNVINEKVDSMTLAQEFVRRIIWIFTAFSLFFIIYSIKKFLQIQISITDFLYKENLIFIIILLLFILFLWNIVLSISLYIIKKKEKEKS